MLVSFWRGLDALEKRALVFIVSLHLLAITIPYFWALAITPPGYEYSGLLFSPDDQNVHLSWARQAAEGHVFSRDLFTTENLNSAERPLFFNALTTLMGVLSLAGVPLILSYHALRVLFALLALIALYALSTRIIPDRRTRIVALVLVAFSGGAGFLALLFPGRIFIDRPDGSFPMMPEAFTFASSFIYSINSAAVALMIVVYACALVAQSSFNAKNSKRVLLLGFCAALLLSNIHTYDAIPLIGTLLIWTMLNNSATFRKRWSVAVVLVSGAALPMVYQLIVFGSSAEFRLKALTPTPAPALVDVLARGTIRP